MRNRLVVLATVLGLVTASSAQAAHHLWAFSEMFSNASGTVQYMEMFCTGANEQNLGTFGITSTTHSMSFLTNLSSGATTNTWILVATSNFASLPGGIAPDYVIPPNFFPTSGGTLNYASGTNTWAYGTVPTDGVTALHRDGSTGPNAPKNFAGGSGSVNAANAVPMVRTWGLIVLVGAMLFMASGLLRRREVEAA